MTRKKRPPTTPERLAALKAMPYQDYLRTPEWYRRRAVVLKFAANRCQVCYSDKGALQVHHRTYERLGQELLSDTILLCESCHALFHHYGRLK